MCKRKRRNHTHCKNKHEHPWVECGNLKWLELPSTVGMTVFSWRGQKGSKCLIEAGGAGIRRSHDLLLGVLSEDADYRINLATPINNWSGLKGLTIQAFAPASLPARLKVSEDSVVNIITGIPLCSGRAWIAFKN